MENKRGKKNRRLRKTRERSEIWMITKELQNYSTVKVQRDDFAKNINRETQPPPHAVLSFFEKQIATTLPLFPRPWKKKQILAKIRDTQSLAQSWLQQKISFRFCRIFFFFFFHYVGIEVCVKKMFKFSLVIFLRWKYINWASYQRK